MFWRIILDIVAWGGGELGMGLGIGWLKRKINAWENRQLQSKLRVIDCARVTLEDITEESTTLLIGLHLDSKIPTVLFPKIVKGTITVSGFKISIDWDYRLKSQHIIKEIEANGDGWWGFRIQPSRRLVKRSSSSKWSLDFMVEFQHELSKIFRNIKFKIRDSDAKRVQEVSVS